MDNARSTMYAPKTESEAETIPFDNSPASVDPATAAPRTRADTARQIIRTAHENGVPLRNDPGLVSVLAGVSIDDGIPKELYGVIAEVLAWFQGVDRSSKPEKGPPVRH